MHSSLIETSVAAVNLITIPRADAKPISSQLAAREERKSQPWKAFIMGREVQTAEMFVADAPIRIIRGEELAPLLIGD